MNIDLMRKIDRWVGIPLCFSLTLILRLSPAKPRGNPRNILFIELSEMGSAVLADPAMRKAKKETNGTLYFVIFKRNAASLSFLNTVDPKNIFTIRENNLFALAIDTLRFLQWTRKNNIDTVIDLELFSRFTALLSGLSGARNKVGFYRFHGEGLYRGEFLTHKVAYNPHIHIAKNFIAMINALLSPQPQVPYSKTIINEAEIILHKVAVEEQKKQAMRLAVASAFPRLQANHRIVLFNPNASDMLPHRRWPHTNFMQLALQVLEQWQDVVILLTGSDAEKSQAEKLIAACNHPRMVNFAGCCKLENILELYAISTLMVTNDSGPSHFSSVTDLQTIVLFGPETPALYGSLGKSEAVYAGLACSPCVSAANHRKTACNAPICMDAITPAQVFEKVKQYL